MSSEVFFATFFLLSVWKWNFNLNWFLAFARQKNCQNHKRKSVNLIQLEWWKNANFFFLIRYHKSTDWVIQKKDVRFERKLRNGLCIWKILKVDVTQNLSINFIVHLVKSTSQRKKIYGSSQRFVAVVVVDVCVISVCPLVCLCHNFIFFGYDHKWVIVKESFFFFISVCSTNIWLSIWTPLPVVIKMTFKQWWWAKVLFVCRY